MEQEHFGLHALYCAYRVDIFLLNSVHACVSDASSYDMQKTITIVLHLQDFIDCLTQNCYVNAWWLYWIWMLCRTTKNDTYWYTVVTICRLEDSLVNLYPKLDNNILFDCFIIFLQKLLTFNLKIGP